MKQVVAGFPKDFNQIKDEKKKVVTPCHLDLSKDKEIKLFK